MAKDRRLVVLEAGAGEPDQGQMFALPPGDAAGIALPTFRVEAALPATGSVKGEAVYDRAHRQGFVWSGSKWEAIAPNPILTYATEAQLKADTSPTPGTYASAGDTGSLWIRRGTGWSQIGITPYGNLAALLADTPLPGSLGETLDDGGLWEMRTGGWRSLATRELADTAAVSAWANPANALGKGCNIGDRATALDVGIEYVRLTTGWKPATIWEAADEAAILAATWALDGQEAIDLATGHTWVRKAGAWVQDPIRHYPTEAALRAATPPEGVFAYAEDTGKVFARHNGGWIGLITGCDDPIPVGSIVAFPTVAVPSGFLECNGQAIPAGARYDELRTLLAPATTVPDLRGQFLRGGSAVDTLLARVAWKTGKPHTDFTTNSPVDIAVSLTATGSGTTSGAGAHDHGVGTQNVICTDVGGHDLNPSGGGNPEGYKHFHPDGAHTHTVTVTGTATGRVTGTAAGTVNGGGDSETAPDHVRVIFCIKAYRLEITTPTGTLPTTIGTPRADEVLAFDGATSTWTNKKAGKMLVAATAPATPAQGDSWFNTTRNQLEIWDGTKWQTSGAEDMRFVEGEITIGADGTAGNEIILIKGLAPTNDGVYMAVCDADLTAEHQSISFHLLTSNMTGAAPMKELHSHNAGSVIELLRYFWKDATDSYVVVAKFSASAVGKKYRIGMMSPTADLSAVKLDGVTRSTGTSGSVIKPGNTNDQYHFHATVTMGAAATAGSLIALARNIPYDNSGIIITVSDDTASSGASCTMHIIPQNGATLQIREIHSTTTGDLVERFVFDWNATDSFWMGVKLKGSVVGRHWHIGMMSQTSNLSRITVDGSGTCIDGAVRITPGTYDYKDTAFIAAVEGRYPETPFQTAVKDLIKAEAPKLFPAVATPGHEPPGSNGIILNITWRPLKHGMKETWFGYASHNWNQILYFPATNGVKKHFWNTVKLVVGTGVFEKTYDDERTSTGMFDYWFHWGDDNNKIKGDREVMTEVSYFENTVKNSAYLFIHSRYRRASDDSESLLWCRMEFDQKSNKLDRYAVNSYSGDQLRLWTVS